LIKAIFPEPLNDSQEQHQEGIEQLLKSAYSIHLPNGVPEESAVLRID